VRGIIAALLVAFLVLSSHVALAWGPHTHHAMVARILEEDSVKDYLPLFGLDKAAIIEAATEPMPAEVYQWGGWRKIRNDGKEHNDFINDPNFACLSLTKFVGFILHDCTDCGVPLGHSPANELLDNKLLEAILESGYDKSIAVPSWSSLPIYTGSYSQKVKSFYRDQIELTQWFKTHLTPASLKIAGQRGVKNGLRLGQVVLLDVFLSLDPGDTNCDGRVDTVDLLTVLQHYGASSGMLPKQGDLNGDGAVDVKDMQILLINLHRDPVGGPDAAKHPPKIPGPQF